MKSSLKYCQHLILGLVFISLFAFGESARAAGPPLSLDDYWQKVEETQTLITSLEETSPEARRDQLLAAAGQWAQVTQVKLPDETLLSVDHSFLVAQLRADPPRLDQLNELLTTLLETHRTWPRPQHTASDIRTLSPILARSEFQWSEETAGPKEPSFLDRLRERIREFFSRIWEYIKRFLDRLLPDVEIPTGGALSGVPNLFPYLLTGLGILILALVLGLILRELLVNLIIEAKVDPEAEAGDEILTADTAFKRAQKLSTTGDYRTAVRYLYLSSLLILDERGLLRYDRTQTNREYLRSVAHLPKLATILREVIEVFDRVWYGYQSLDETAYAQYAAQVTKLRQQK